MDGISPPVELSVQVISDVSEWDILRPEWNGLFESVRTASGPLHSDWMRTWWTIYGPHYVRSQGLKIITFRLGQRLVGILPLYVGHAQPSAMRVRCLRFLSTGETTDEETCPDYLDLLCLPENADDCTAKAIEAIESMAWDQLSLQAMPHDSPLALALTQDQRFVRNGSNPCPAADLSGGFEQYLQRLSSNGRQQARRHIRDAEKLGVTFELADEQSGPSFFSDLIDLHQTRWTAEGKRGCFASARFTQFHRQLIQLWIPTNRVVLARLKCGDDAIAALYGFCHHDRFEFYQSGVGETPEVRSPGILCHLLLMRELASRNIRTYDFLRGSSVYKDRLATGKTDLVDLQTWRTSIRAVAYQTTRSAVKSLVRPFRKRVQPEPNSAP